MKPIEILTIYYNYQTTKNPNFNHCLILPYEDDPLINGMIVLDTYLKKGKGRLHSKVCSDIEILNFGRGDEYNLSKFSKTLIESLFHSSIIISLYDYEDEEITEVIEKQIPIDEHQLNFFTFL